VTDLVTMNRRQALKLTLMGSVGLFAWKSVEAVYDPVVLTPLPLDNYPFLPRTAMKSRVPSKGMIFIGKDGIWQDGKKISHGLIDLNSFT